MSDDLCAGGDDLLGDLRRAGSADSEGHFTVDRVAARRKLGVYRFATPEHWTLPLLAHATRAGAKTLLIESFGLDARIAHDGASLTANEMERLLTDSDAPVSAAFAPLIDCVDALMVLGATFDLSSDALVLRVVKGEPRELVAEGRPRAGLGMSIHGARVISAAPFLGKGEPAPLAVWGRWAPLKLTLNEEVLSRGALLPSDALVSRSLGTPPLREEPTVRDPWGADFPAMMSAVTGDGRLTLVVDGLAFDVPSPRLEALGVQCVAWCTRLSLDVSYGAVLQDERLAAVQQWIDAEAGSMLALVVKHLDRFTRAWTSEVRHRMLRRFKEAAAIEQRATTRSVLLSAPLRIEAALQWWVDREALSRLLDQNGPLLDVEALERLELATWSRYLNGEKGQGTLHAKLCEALHQKVPAGSTLRPLWRGVTRAALEDRLDEGRACAAAAREIARGLASAESLANALDVEAIVRRWAGELDEAERLHAEAVRRGEPCEEARHKVLGAELLAARGSSVAARGLLEEARSALLGCDPNDADAALIHREIAELLWAEGDLKSAYQLFRRSGDRFEVESVQMLGVLRRLVRRQEGLVFTLRDVVVGLERGEPLGTLWSISATGLLVELETLLDGHFLWAPCLPLSPQLRPLLQTAERQILSAEWDILSRRMVFALRLENRWAEADRLLARRRLVLRPWPLEGRSVLTWGSPQGRPK